MNQAINQSNKQAITVVKIVGSQWHNYTYNMQSCGYASEQQAIF